MINGFQFIYLLGNIGCAIIILIHFLKKPAAGTAILMVSFIFATLGSAMSLFRSLAYHLNQMGDVNSFMQVFGMTTWIHRIAHILLLVGLIVHFASNERTKAPLHPHNRG